MNQFQVGQTVQLVSGGPVMTVKALSTSKDKIFCQWFAGKKLEHGDFPPASLNAVAANNATPAPTQP